MKIGVALVVLLALSNATQARVASPKATSPALNSLVQGVWASSPPEDLETAKPAPSHRTPSPTTASASNPTEQETLDIADYFELKEYSDLTLSGDGQWLAFISRPAAAKFGSGDRQVYVTTTTGKRTQAVAIAPDATQLTWTPGVRRLAYLSSHAGFPQVFTYDIDRKLVEQRTATPYGVVSFGFQPQGTALAVIVHGERRGATSLRRQLAQAQTGVLLDSDTASAYDFIGSGGAIPSEPNRELWIQEAGGGLQRMDIPGSVNKFFWSKDGKQLSVVYVADGVTQHLTKAPSASVGILDVRRRRFITIAVGADRRGENPPVVYDGGEWSSDGKSLLLRRTVGDRPWSDRCFVDWAIVSARDPQAERLRRWYPAQAYNPGTDLKFHPLPNGSTLVETTERGVRSLYRWSDTGSSQSSRVSALQGSQSGFAFSTDLISMAFINQSMGDPPEIFLQIRIGAPLRKLTAMNEPVARKSSVRVKSIEWKSADGMTVHGWLLEPPSDSRPPWPLITYLHGGPGAAIVNEFAQSFGKWPYPFEVLATQGIAVFFPNYRGTATYGREFISPKSIDSEPIADVLSGIRYLVQAGVADEQKLALAGHSHGAWLGSMILTRSKIFVAASFAEGLSNMMATYELMPGALNREVHDIVHGANPYDKPERYAELSPALHFASVSTPTLFESGANAGAIWNLGFAKAAKRFRVPSESIVYPNTGHVMSDATLQRDAATRNLQWFRFWLTDSPESNGEDSFEVERARWRELRLEKTMSSCLGGTC